VKVKLIQDVVDQVGPFIIPVYPIESIARAASVDGVGISGALQSKGTVELREVIQRQMLLS